MSAIEYKIWFDGTSAKQEQLDKVDEIVVDQAVDRAWEARIKIPVCVNNDGKWEGENEAWMKAFTRIRVEINPGNGKFVPLIDGPVVAFNSERSAQPGKSVVVVVVHDDSALLDRSAKVDVQQGKKDSDLARQILSELTGTPQIDETPPQPNQTTDASVQRGTPMQYLRELARRNQNWHAYVLPGSDAGASIGCFRKFPEETDGLPARSRPQHRTLQRQQQSPEPVHRAGCHAWSRSRHAANQFRELSRRYADGRSTGRRGQHKPGNLPSASGPERSSGSGHRH
jgi:hypothetical protein